MGKTVINTSNKLHWAKRISYFVILAGAAVMAGWLFDIRELKSIYAGWISMKFTTAFSFVISGITLYFLARAREGEHEKALVALSMTSLVLSLIMGLFFFSTIFNVQTGIEFMFVSDPGDPGTILPGRPSMLTVTNFLFIAFAAILTILKPDKLSFKLRAIGCVVGLVGLVAVVGYVFHIGLLSYSLPGINNPMAAHTALLFVLLGTGFLCL